jgi:single-strand DNA-binding protein
MSRGHQRVIATGHLGDDPAVKATQNGGLVADFRIAVTEVFKDRSGEKTEHTEWLRVKAFGRTAEVAQQFLTKGRLVTIEGKLHTEKWQSSDGSDRYSTWIYIGPHGLTLHGGTEHTKTKREHQGRPADDKTSPAPPTQHAENWPEDDDLPF